MYSVTFLCDELLKFVTEQGFKESTLKRYKISLNVFVRFCNERGVINYTPKIGQEFADDLIPKNSGKVSSDRKYFRKKAVQHFNHYFEYGCFVFEHPKRKHFDSDSLGILDEECKRYKEHVIEQYDNQNTIKFYLYDVYLFLRFLVSIGINNLTQVTVNIVFRYLEAIKENRLKGVLCVLKFYFKFINRHDLYNAIYSIRPIKKKKLIPYLTKEESDKIWTVLKGNVISYKEKAIFLLGFTLGIRACDTVNLKLKDINWEKDTISFIQQKTGNAVNLPLSPVLGNALFNYITKERNHSSYDNVFLSIYPPFKPLRDHSSCYYIVKKVIDLSGIEMGERFCGIHFLRHNVASNLINKNMPIETVAAVLGHASPDSTNIYITVNEDKLRECTLSLNLLEDEDNG
ncbi:MAG: tyrosine-type recombinase/integrase [Floccifex porci]|uniref:tyrosine-type recombinase/integrase n=1 Tax=Floccifex porci TaxID=2606629 RepID=UPI003F0381F6